MRLCTSTTAERDREIEAKGRGDTDEGTHDIIVSFNSQDTLAVATRTTRCGWQNFSPTRLQVWQPEPRDLININNRDRGRSRRRAGRRISRTRMKEGRGRREATTEQNKTKQSSTQRERKEGSKEEKAQSAGFKSACLLALCQHSTSLFAAVLGASWPAPTLPAPRRSPVAAATLSACTLVLCGPGLSFPSSLCFSSLCFGRAPWSGRWRFPLAFTGRTTCDDCVHPIGSLCVSTSALTSFGLFSLWVACVPYVKLVPRPGTSTFPCSNFYDECSYFDISWSLGSKFPYAFSIPLQSEDLHQFLLSQRRLEIYVMIKSHDCESRFIESSRIRSGFKLL